MVDILGKKLKYTGTKQPKVGERDVEGQPLLPYLPSPELVEAVNLAIVLERPLLLKGEPGCGKTQLARAVAYELGLPLESWYVKSTSRARDGLYTYDSIGRLWDAQLASSSRFIQDEEIGRISNPATYVKWGPLGRAFRNDQPTVVLIDEIDKADIDFPNDLLLELDERRFVVEETGQNEKAKVPPIVLITSNDEKDLPDAFLRRCLFHYVEFPNRERLKEIIFAIYPHTSKSLAEQAVNRFEELRQRMQEDKGRIGKKVSTSELIDWVNILHRYPEDQVLSQLDGKIPFPGVLLKSWDDHQRYCAR